MPLEVSLRFRSGDPAERMPRLRGVRGDWNPKRRPCNQWPKILSLSPSASITKSTNGGMQYRFWQRCIRRNGETSSRFSAPSELGTRRSSSGAGGNRKLQDGSILRGRAGVGKKKNSKRRSLLMIDAWILQRTRSIATRLVSPSKLNGTIRIHSSTVTSIISAFYSTSAQSMLESSLLVVTNCNRCLSRLGEEHLLETQRHICQSSFPELKEAVAEDAQ